MFKICDLITNQIWSQISVWSQINHDLHLMIWDLTWDLHQWLGDMLVT